MMHGNSNIKKINRRLVAAAGEVEGRW